MSEDEIIKQLKDSCILDNNCYEVDCLYEKDLEAIRSLLDLYNKEKEKNKSIEAQRLRDMCYKKDGNYISKDKIREKIEEIKKDENVSISSFQEYAQKYSIDKLKELLEERN